MRQRILILCSGNSCRSQMAEAWLKALHSDQIEAFSAGSTPAGYVHPLAVEVMREVGIDLSGGRSKHMNEYLDQAFDVVVTVCDPAREVCPAFPGPAKRLHHSFDDPAAASGDDAARLIMFRQVRDEIREWIQASFGESA